MPLISVWTLTPSIIPTLKSGLALWLLVTLSVHANEASNLGDPIYVDCMRSPWLYFAGFDVHLSGHFTHTALGVCFVTARRTWLAKAHLKPIYCCSRKRNTNCIGQDNSLEGVVSFYWHLWLQMQSIPVGCDMANSWVWHHSIYCLLLSGLLLTYMHANNHKMQQHSCMRGHVIWVTSRSWSVTWPMSHKLLNTSCCWFVNVLEKSWGVHFFNDAPFLFLFGICQQTVRTYTTMFIYIYSFFSTPQQV